MNLVVVKDMEGVRQGPISIISGALIDQIVASFVLIRLTLYIPNRSMFIVYNDFKLVLCLPYIVGEINLSLSIC